MTEIKTNIFSDRISQVSSLNEDDLILLGRDVAGVKSNVKIDTADARDSLLGTTLNALYDYNTNGILTQTSAGNFAGRTLTGTANKITVSNGNGVSGNPTITIPTTLYQQTIRAETGAGLAILNNSGNAVATFGATGANTTFAGNVNIAGELTSLFPSGTATLTPLGLTTAGSPTTSTNSFRYQVIGKRVYCNFYVILTSKGGMAGEVAFDGLPFASLNTGGARIAFNIGSMLNGYDISAISGAIGLGVYLVNNTTRMRLRVITTTGGTTSLDASNIADNFQFYGQFFYEIA